MSGHRDPRCSYTALRGVHCHGQLNTGDHPKYRQKTPIAVAIFSEHVEVYRGDRCSNEGSALAVLYIDCKQCIMSVAKPLRRTEVCYIYFICCDCYFNYYNFKMFVLSVNCQLFCNKPKTVA